MALIDIKLNPTRRDLVFFACFWLITFGLLAFLAVRHRTENSLFYMGVFTFMCFAVSLGLNNDFPRRLQLLGALIPALLLSIWGLERFAGVPGGGIAVVLLTLGVTGAAASLASAPVGTRLYRGWMFAALPIGWTVSHLILGLVFYLVFTPIGLALRMSGTDPMSRGFDRSASTYWLPHRQQGDAGRYFRQF